MCKMRNTIMEEQKVKAARQLAPLKKKLGMIRLRKAMTFALLTCILGLAASLLPYGYGFEENLGLSAMFKLRGKRQAPSDVVVISLSKESANYLKLPSNPKTWPRSYHAQLIHKLV